MNGKLWFGTATDIPGIGEHANVDYMTILNDTNIFGQLTPANSMKFQYTEPEPNVYTFSEGDELLDIAEANGQFVTCDNLVWVAEVSEWVLNGNWTAETLTEVMRNHIIKVITHWGDRCHGWEVVNEPLAANGSFAPSVWYDNIGPEYFFLAFQFAMEAVQMTGKDIKLFFNDYNIEYPNPKTTGAYELVKELKRRNLQIDFVGLESHFIVGETPSLQQQIEAKQGFLDLGVDVMITELDVRFLEAPFYTAAGEALQAQAYYDTVASCVEVGPRCQGITVWDFDDQYSWVPSAFPGQGGADLFNSTLQRKPAYYACAEALMHVPCTVCSSS